MKTQNTKKLQRLTLAAVLAALSLVFMVVLRFPIFPATPFYEMEFADVPILICATVLGPVYGLVSLFVVCLIQALTVSASSGIIGFIMHFVASGCMILSVYFVRKRISGIKGVIISDFVGAIVMTIVMIPMNMWLTSVFMHLPTTEFVKGFLLYCVAFNLIKSSANLILNSLISPIITKQISKMRKE